MRTAQALLGGDGVELAESGFDHFRILARLNERGRVLRRDLLAGDARGEGRERGRVGHDEEDEVASDVSVVERSRAHFFNESAYVKICAARGHSP